MIARPRHYYCYKQSICQLSDHSSKFQVQVLSQTQQTLLVCLALTWLRRVHNRRYGSGIAEAIDTQMQLWCPSPVITRDAFCHKVGKGLMRVWLTSAQGSHRCLESLSFNSLLPRQPLIGWETSSHFFRVMNNPDTRNSTLRNIRSWISDD